MARVNVPDGEGREASRIWQRTPHIGAGLQAMGSAMYEQCSIPVREREAMRMRIAQLNQCVV
jgi:hypothetical protein